MKSRDGDDEGRERRIVRDFYSIVMIQRAVEREDYGTASQLAANQVRAEQRRRRWWR